MRTSLVFRYVKFADQSVGYRRALSPGDPDPLTLDGRSSGASRPTFLPSRVSESRQYRSLEDLGTGRGIVRKRRTPPTVEIGVNGFLIKRGVVDDVRLVPADVVLALDNCDAELARLQVTVDAIRSAQLAIMEDGYARGRKVKLEEILTDTEREKLNASPKTEVVSG